MSDTPKSDAALKQFPIFTEAIFARLDAGKRVYGDSSFDRPADRLVTEIQEELMDVAGWSFIMWTRLEKLREQLPKI